MSEYYYLAMDGDGIGRSLEKAILDGTDMEVSKFSEEFTSCLDRIRERVQEVDGNIIYCAGDGLLARSTSIVGFRHVVSTKNTELFTFSFGIGNTKIAAFIGLKLAKARGGDRCVEYFQSEETE